MNNTSAVPNKTLSNTGIYIKGNFSASIDNLLNKKVTADGSKVLTGKAILRNLFENDEQNKNLVASFIYTIKQGDDKRLSKEGVLRVYNIAELVNIPIVSLLGKWNESLIGITLVCINNNTWSIKGGLVRIQKQQSYMSAAIKDKVYKTRYHAFVTNQSLPAVEVREQFKRRGDAENRIKELKEDFGLQGFCMDDFCATESRCAL